MERNWKCWLHAAARRAVRTMAQSAAAILGTCAVLSEVDWRMTASTALLSGLLSLLMSLSGLPEEEIAAPPQD